MFYDKKVRYLSYFRDGERISGAGFIKLEARDHTLRLEMAVKGLRDMSGVFPVFLQGAGQEKVLGDLNLQAGSGEFRHECQMEDESGETAFSYAHLCGIRLPLVKGQEVSCRWKEERPKGQSGAGVQTERESEKPGANARTGAGAGTGEEPQGLREANSGAGARRKLRIANIARLGKESKETQEGLEAETEPGDSGSGTEIGQGLSGEEAQPEIKRKDMETESTVRLGKDLGETGDGIRTESTEAGNEVSMAESRAETGGKTVETEDKVRPEREQGNASPARSNIEIRQRSSGDRSRNRKETFRIDRPSTIRLHESKWEQLCAIYPHIHPFRDTREYLSITPSDFVLLPEAAYRVAHNSFLLHGYYNYHHLILTRVENRGETIYYLGVPGNYFEKEKQVAVMFGFESFECAKEPAEQGDFGYYMMRTEV